MLVNLTNKTTMSGTDENDTAVIPENLPVLAKNPPREDLVATAVKFLQNPKVQSSPLEQKKQFLKKKGLTDEEINKAVEISGAENAVAVASQPPPAVSAVQQTRNVAQPPVPLWSRLRDYSALAIIIGGVVYGIYTLYKKYVEPIFLRQSREQAEKLSRVESGIMELKTGFKTDLQELQHSIKELRERLNDQNSDISRMSTNLAIYKDAMSGGSSNTNITDLQTEISSLKGLLLSSKQFPAAPVVPPVIPQWQMKSPPSSTSFKDADCASIALESGDQKIEISSEKQSQLPSTNTKPFTRTDQQENYSHKPDISSQNGRTAKSNGEFATSNDSDEISPLLENGVNPTNMNGGRLQQRPMLVSPTKVGSLPVSNSETQPVEDESDVD
ncbi:unnamed protein product [Clavelina lepadiformis]|uniref:Peroxisomal membrane protein PEX14 n=1 Tax=Clavelina lepadiformis TaxID=159417 RepID=A0ABP0GFX0_CLALP